MTSTNLDRIESLVRRLERLGVNLDERAAADAYGNPGYVASGELIESAWGNAVSDHVVRIFPGAGERDTWTTPPEGAVCVTLNDGVLWERRSGVWAPPRNHVAAAFGAVVPDANLAGPAVVDLTTIGPATPYPYPTVAQVTLGAFFGYGAAQPVDVVFSILTVATGEVANGQLVRLGHAGFWAPYTLVAQFAFAANVDSRVKVQFNFNNGTGGNCHTAGGVLATYYA